MITRAVSVGLVATVLLVSAATAQGGFEVRFDQDEYGVAPGGVFDVSVLFDADDTQPGTQSLPNGLLSMGVSLTFEPAYAEVASIDIVSLLDDDGTGAPGHRQFGPGFGAAAGFFADSGTYNGSELVTFHLKNLATEADLSPGNSYPLALSFYDNTASFTNFIDGGSQQDIDPSIAFGSSTVIVPEPVTLALLAVGGLALIGTRRRTRIR